MVNCKCACPLIPALPCVFFSPRSPRTRTTPAARVLLALRLAPRASLAVVQTVGWAGGDNGEDGRKAFLRGLLLIIVLILRKGGRRLR